MIIDATRLPENIERGAQFSTNFKTAIIETDGGNEIANIQWVFPRSSGQCAYGIQSMDDIEECKEFFVARRGRARGFLFKDWSDYIVEAGTILGVGDSTDGTDGTDDYQIIRYYDDAVLPFGRNITRPILSPVTTLVVKVDGVTKTLTTHYTIAASGGIIHFTPGNVPMADAVVTCECEFDIPVRFTSDTWTILMEWERVGSIPDLGIIEVRDN